MHDAVNAGDAVFDVLGQPVVDQINVAIQSTIRFVSLRLCTQALIIAS